MFPVINSDKHIKNYLQSGAGHHLESGSPNKTLLTIKSSYLLKTSGLFLSKICISLGCIDSEHCGQAKINKKKCKGIIAIKLM